jgi:hypothetical protein
MPSTLPGETGRLSDLLADASLSIVAKLFKNAINADKPNLQLADFTEADFPGYLPQTATDWGMADSPYEEIGEAVSAPVIFTAGAVVDVQIVYGMYAVIQKGVEAPALGDVVIFPTPISIRFEGQTIEQQVRVTSITLPE